jgi:hypothetical protein
LTVMLTGPSGPGSVIPVLGYCCAVLKVRGGPRRVALPKPHNAMGTGGHAAGLSKLNSMRAQLESCTRQARSTC